MSFGFSSRQTIQPNILRSSYLEVSDLHDGVISALLTLYSMSHMSERERESRFSTHHSAVGLVASSSITGTTCPSAEFCGVLMELLAFHAFVSAFVAVVAPAFCASLCLPVLILLTVHASGSRSREGARRESLTSTRRSSGQCLITTCKLESVIAQPPSFSV